MKRQWTADDLVEHWTLSPDDRALLANRAPTTRLGFALLLKHFQYEGRFPQHKRDVPTAAIVHVARQLGLPPERYGSMTGAVAPSSSTGHRSAKHWGFVRPLHATLPIWRAGSSTKCCPTSAAPSACRPPCANAAASVISSCRHRAALTA
jgi:hypothetical protein